MQKDTRKYIMVLLITTGIFIVVFGLVNYLNNQKLAHVDDLQRKITADLIATETQFDLLKTASCDLLGDSVLSQGLAEFGRKLDYAETNQGSNHADVIQLKKYYSLLQVKDYLLMQELAQKCGTNIDSILYFYQDACPECTKQGYVLTEIKKQYPEIRIYSFDTDLDFSVIETFTSLYDFGDVFPTIIVGDKTYQGLQKISDIESLFPYVVEAQVEAEQVQNIKEYIVSEIGANEEDISLIKNSDTEYVFEVSDEQSGVVLVLEDGDYSLKGIIEEKTNES